MHLFVEPWTFCTWKSYWGRFVNLTSISTLHMASNRLLKKRIENSKFTAHLPELKMEEILLNKRCCHTANDNTVIKPCLRSKWHPTYSITDKVWKLVHLIHLAFPKSETETIIKTKFIIKSISSRPTHKAVSPFLIQHLADVANTAHGELVVVQLVSWCGSSIHYVVAFFLLILALWLAWSAFRAWIMLIIKMEQIWKSVYIFLIYNKCFQFLRLHTTMYQKNSLETRRTG